VCVVRRERGREVGMREEGIQDDGREFNEYEREQPLGNLR